MDLEQTTQEKKQQTEEQLVIIEKAIRFIVFNTQPDANTHDLRSVLGDLFNLKDMLRVEQ